jgi:hypothetical protein
MHQPLSIRPDQPSGRLGRPQASVSLQVHICMYLKGDTYMIKYGRAVASKTMYVFTIGKSARYVRYILGIN